MARARSRRAFLRLGFTAAFATAALAACGQAATPTAAPKPADKPADKPAAAPTKPDAPAGAAPTKPAAAAPAGAATKPADKPAAAPAVKPAAATGKAVTIRFITTETDPPSQKFYTDANNEFAAENPNVKFEMEYVGFDDRLKKLTTAFAARTAPHLSDVVDWEVLEYARLGYLINLDELMQQSGGPSKWQPTSLDGALYQGKTFGLPYNGGSYRTLWYWQDIFDRENVKPPTTWDEYREVSAKLTKGDQYGTVVPGAKGGWTLNNYMSFLWQTGETVFDKEFNVVFGKDGAVKALEFYRELTKYSPPGFASYSFGETIDAFVTGKVGSQIYAGRTLTRVNLNAPDRVKLARGAKRPVGPIGGEVGFVGWDIYSLYNDKVGIAADEHETSKKYLRHIALGKWATEFCLTVPGHLIPPHNDNVNDPKFKTGSGHPLLSSHKAEIEWLFHTKNGLQFTTEAGAQITKEGVTPSGVVNPYWAPIESNQVIPSMVQRHIVQNEPARQAVDWAVREMKRLVEDAKRKQSR